MSACNIVPGVFHGGEIEPGTFHGGEIEPGTFHHWVPPLDLEPAPEDRTRGPLPRPKPGDQADVSGGDDAETPAAPSR